MPKPSKGVSPLIATVLLIAFTITVAAFLATWSTGFVRGQTEKAAQTEKLRAQCESAFIRVESALYDSGAGTITAVVYNPGTEKLTDWKFTIFYTTVEFVELTPPNSADILETGQRKSFAVSGVTAAPDHLLVQSLTCPTEADYTCTYSAGTFRC